LRELLKDGGLDGTDHARDAAQGKYPTNGETPMADANPRSGPLTCDVFVTPSIPVVASEIAPGTTQRPWFPPISSTLISGQRDAVLVDTPVTVAQAQALADWIAARGKNLTTIYATHGHGDHFFGATTILQRFPGSRLVATPKVIEIMRQQASPPYLASYWYPRFPGQIADQLVIAEALTGNVIDLEGQELVVVPLGHTDTDNTTCLHVPLLGLVAAGDSVYNDTHLHLGESDAQGRRAWLAALDTIAALHPRAVIAGHQRPENDDDPRNIEKTRQYIHTFERLLGMTATARELYDQMLALYPRWANPGALWDSARAAKPEARRQA
jgi:glyoxylase-like metal-dependent hydrolase (beta-lactamase superfamily II)